MSLRDTIKADALSVFCNTGEFAEVVTYYPRNGEAREIDAVVFREQLSILPEDGDNVTPLFEIHVANTVNRGISTSELNLGGDSLEFASRTGQSVSRRYIQKLLGHDEGMLILECR